MDSKFGAILKFTAQGVADGPRLRGGRSAGSSGGQSACTMRTVSPCCFQQSYIFLDIHLINVDEHIAAILIVDS